MNVDWLFKNLSKAVSGETNDFFETIVYLDVEQLSGIYSGLTGLRERPKVEVQNVGGEYTSSFLSSTSMGMGFMFSQMFDVSDCHLLRALMPGLEMAYPRVTDPSVLRIAQKRRVWMDGVLKNTLYNLPRGIRYDGRTTTVMLEFIQNDIKCSLTLLNEYMSSVYRPFVTEERIFEEKAELLGYLHSYEEKKVAISAAKEKIIYQAVVTPVAILRK